MAGDKKYYWLKLQSDFFSSKRIKKLRKMAGGDTYLIIYLKMQLKALKTDGILTWTGLESEFADELALDLDEEPDDVKVTLAFLSSCGLIETSDNFNFFLPYVVENTGSETAAAERMRDMRSKQKLIPERNNVTQCSNEVQNCYTEIEKEKEKKKEIEKKRFVPPTLEEVRAYVKERNSLVDPIKFFEYYETGGWKDSKGNPVRNWKQKLLTWEKKDGTGRNAPISNDPSKYNFKKEIEDLMNGQ